MDVLAVDLLRSARFGAPGEGPPPDSLRRRLAILLAALDVRRSAGGPSRDGVAATVSSRGALLALTATEIVLGIGLLVVTSVVVPIAPAIASPALDGTALAGPAGGVLLWTLFGLLGSVRTFSTPEGAGHFTFHLPFVGAATILGGPTAGAWVAMLATTDRRELQSQPWYGVLANHASLVIAAVFGGIAYAVLEGSLAAMTGDRGFATFVAIIAAGVILETVANGLAFVTIKIRDGMSWAGVVGIIVDDFRSETLLEIALIWVLVIATATIGWWAPLMVGLAIVVYLASSSGPDIDPLTGMYRKQAFLDKVDRKVGWMRIGMLPGGTLMMFDLNGFSAINNRYSYAVGDEVIRVLGARLLEVFPRQEDIRSRLMGDEFAIFLVGLTDPVKAESLARELLAALQRPIVSSVGVHNVSASIGVVVVPAEGLSTPSAAALFKRAENSERLGKRLGDQGGVHMWSRNDPGAPPREQGDHRGLAETPELGEGR